MTWYNTLFVLVFGIFIVKNIFTWIFGEIDIDIDGDGDTDIDSGTMFSFKGLLHFMMGFTSILCGYGYEETKSFSTPVTFEWWVYLVAVGCGLIVSYILFLLYKHMMKLNQENNENPDFNDKQAKVYINEGNGIYQVIIETPQGTYKRVAESTKTDYRCGDIVKITYNKETKKMTI